MRSYRHYSDEAISALIEDIESAIENGLATPEDHRQLALLESELEEREWV